MRASREPKRLRNVCRVVAGLVLLTGLALIWRERIAVEHTFEGQPLDYWFRRLPLTVVRTRTVAYAGSITADGQQYGGTASETRRALEALEAIGTNSTAFLLQKLQARDSALERKITRLAARVGIPLTRFRNAELERFQAVTGLIRLPDLPPYAEGSLIRLSTNHHPEIMRAARHVLTVRQGTLPGIDSLHAPSE